MANIRIYNRVSYDDSNIGALVCRTPKIPGDRNDHNSCILVRSVSELESNFGDPFISPSKYTELLVAHDLVSRNIPVYISSVYEMKDNDDDFAIPYNGYTEFVFLDNNLRDSIGYKLKSNIKFCQPMLEFNFSINRLEIYASLYLLDRSVTRSADDINKLNITSLYKTYTISFDTTDVPDSVDKITDDSITDDSIKQALEDIGLEIKFTNCGNKLSFIKELIKRKKLRVSSEQPIKPAVVQRPGTEPERPVSEDIAPQKPTTPYDPTDPAWVDYNHYIDVKTAHDEWQVKSDLYKQYLTDLGNYQYDLSKLKYRYNINSNSYDYNFNDEPTIINSYKDAIDLLKESLIEPHWVCIGQILKPITHTDDNGNIIRIEINDLEPESYLAVHYCLLEAYPEDCNTYLFISMPDITVDTSLRLLAAEGEFTEAYQLPDQYNCDLFFGYITDYIESTLYSKTPERVAYSTAVISLYNLMLNKKNYLTNSLNGLNISNGSMKLILPEASAYKLLSLRCNTSEIFDIGSPSIYGDRSLSSSPNLQYSHISRNFVRLRRTIKEYLSTRKFTLNTLFNAQSAINYIRTDILDSFVDAGVLTKYDISYTLERQTVKIHIKLLFYGIAQNLNLDFII